MNDLFSVTDEARIEFCRSFRIPEEDWGKADISWSVLAEIGRDHLAQFQSLSESASMYANLIQAISGVHSVRWRVKDASHLVAKIVRKRAEGKAEYAEISAENYFEIVTDLVGIRALHLFKSEFAGIHKELQPLFQEKEEPFANVRDGDPQDFSDECKQLGIEVRKHPAGYRSIHYVKTVRPVKRNLNLEIQVRTVFEEGWSEVDHRVRYPNFSNDPLVVYASLILNRLSGMADEMSAYAMQLSNALSIQREEVRKAKSENDDALQRIGALVQEIENVKEGAVTKEETIKNLKRELVSLRSAANREEIYNNLVGLGAVRPLSGASAVPYGSAVNALAGLVTSPDTHASATVNALAKGIEMGK